MQSPRHAYWFELGCLVFVIGALVIVGGGLRGEISGPRHAAVGIQRPVPVHILSSDSFLPVRHAGDGNTATK